MGVAVVLLGGPPVARGAESCWDCYRLYLRGLVDQEEGRPLHAAAVYQEVLREDSRAGLVNEDLTDAAMASGQTDLALQSALRYVAVSTDNAGAYILLGRVHQARGDGPAARTAFETALALDPGNIEALNLAAGQRSAQDLQGALGLYEKFLRTHPENDDVRSALAEGQRRQGDLNSAIESYEKIVQSDPSNSEALLALAGLYDVSRSTPAGHGRLRETIWTSFRTISTCCLGWVSSNVLAGDLDEASAYLDRALALDPNDGAALVLARLGGPGKGR
jgi:tetratricopeptide (TPR) repeat protein